MLEIRLCCENCRKPLPPDSEEALICTFECTWCTECNDKIIKNVCPNCGGGFSQRPTRPKKYLEKYPPSTTKVFKPKDLSEHQELIKKYKNTPPSLR